jgi:4-amino-4-deoxy-L-arabinose transferase-like glycosyltransferase
VVVEESVRNGENCTLRARGGIAIGLLACAAALIITVTYVLGAAYCPLVEPDETRYAELAREILVRNDWVTPHLNFVKYFEKPPLVYWVSALAYRVLGINEFAARLPSLLAAFGGMVLTAVLAGRMYGRPEAILATLIVATAPLYALLGQTLTLDMALTFFVTAAFTAVWLGYERGDRRWYRVAWVAVAGGVLVKGPVTAVLVGAPVIVFLLIQGGWPALRAVADIRGAALAAAVALPWFVIVSWRNPEFLRYFIIDQHVNRYLWSHEHGEPAWFFLPLLPAACFPWGLLPIVDPRLWWQHRTWRGWGAGTRLLLLWIATTVAFFSLSTSKLITYILPVLPPLAVLLARMLTLGANSDRTQCFARAGWFLLVLGLAVGLAAGLTPMFSDHWRVPHIVPYLYVTGLLLAATGVGVRRALRARYADMPLLTLGAGALALMLVCSAAHSLGYSYRNLGRAAAAVMNPEDRLAVYRHLVHGITFYSRHRVIMVKAWGELAFGSQQGDQRAYFWPDNETLVREWSGGRRLFLVINRKELDELRPRLDPPPRIVAGEGKKVLVVNQGPS